MTSLNKNGAYSGGTLIFSSIEAYGSEYLILILRLPEKRYRN